VLVASIVSDLTDAVTTAIGDYGLYAVFMLMLVDAVFPAASEVVMVYAGGLAAGAFANQNVVLFGQTIDDGWPAYIAIALAGTIGYTLGAIIGGIAAVGSNLVIPGVGLVIAGPIAAALAGAGAGSLAGGLTGALIGWGIPEERVVHYEKGIREGGTVLGVTPKSEEDATFLENEWRNKYNAEHVYR